MPSPDKVDAVLAVAGRRRGLRWRALMRRFAVAAAAAAALAVGCVWLLLWAALPARDAVYPLAGFQSPVEVEFDRHGTPRIHAESREDGSRALGFVTAQERLFQMDLLRRRGAGRLAEIFGGAALESDRWHRVMGFEQVAAAILRRLPDEQQRVLAAYVAGVNQAMDQAAVLPFEFLLLRYRPEPWRAEDSLLAVLGMFENLTWPVGAQERMASVMERALGAKALDFLTPDSDRYTDGISAGRQARRPSLPLPVKELAALLPGGAGHGEQAGLVGVAEALAGSNGWLVGPGKTRDGRAMLANDMHLELRVPNIWYRAELHEPGFVLSGITLPGLPLFISGSNGKLAWGFTNIGGDFVDFVALDVPAAAPGTYRTPQGAAAFERRTETIRAKGMPATTIEVRSTVWGPVLPEPLLGKPVAVHWTALDPAATDLDLLRLADAGDVHEALPVVQDAGGPPLNALLADSQGNIAWTYAGKIPVREGLDGLVSRSWAEGARGWKGYVAADRKPAIVNPPNGFLVNANQPMVGKEYPHVIGHDFDSGYRAYRISQRLAEMQGITERDLLQVQLDVKTDFYRYYQNLALAVLNGHGRVLSPDLQEIRRQVLAWDGQALPESRGLAVLVEFRRILADAVFSPFMARCRELDPAFQYAWRNMDEPLRQLLDAKAPELLPEKHRYADWDAFILDRLAQAAPAAMAACGADSLAEVTWGCVNKVQIEHPFSAVSPWLGALLNMPELAIPGCRQCVRLANRRGGASERLVAAPGHEADGIFHMPTGQSGNPLSAFYRDQQENWVAGAASALLAGETLYRLRFQPLPPR